MEAKVAEKGQPELGGNNHGPPSTLWKPLVAMLILCIVETVVMMSLFPSRVADYPLTSASTDQEVRHILPTLRPDIPTLSTTAVNVTSLPSYFPPRRAPDNARKAGKVPFRVFVANAKKKVPRNYLHCIEQLLRGASEEVTLDPNSAVHVDSGVGLANATRKLLDPADVIPLIVSPVMYDMAFFKSVMCTLTDVALRYLVIVQNSDNADLAAMIDEIATYFYNLDDAEGRSHGSAASEAHGAHVAAFGGRLLVHRHPENKFFSGSMNIGLRLALRKTFWQAPWSLILNSYTDYAPGLAQRMSRLAHTVTARDARRIAELEEEVLSEPNEYTPSWRSLKVLRPHEPMAGVGGGRIFSQDAAPEVMCSYLLPDRIRYAPPDTQITAFQKHTCFVYPGDRDFSGVVMSRLCSLTAGLFDENYVPAYSEDVDLIWRAYALGYKEVYTSGSGYFHYTGVNSRMPGSSVYQLQRARTQRIRRLKWGSNFGHDVSDQRRPTSGYTNPFGLAKVPIDLWIRDQELHECVWNITKNLESDVKCFFNLSTLTLSPAMS